MVTSPWLLPDLVDSHARQPFPFSSVHISWPILDRARPHRLRVVPYRDTVERGLFATRAPSRPNPIGLSLVRLVGREGNRLQVEGLDILDGTPLLDIKPYIPKIDALAGADGESTRSRSLIFLLLALALVLCEAFLIRR
jgi:tRNA (Thr-GGU) A37 N-methylase